MVASSIPSATKHYPSWELLPHQASDLELILNGGFSPLTGFMTQAETEEVQTHKTWRGQFFPVPIQLQVHAGFLEEAGVDKNGLDKDEQHQRIALRDHEGTLIAILHLSEIYTPNNHTPNNHAPNIHITKKNSECFVYLAGACQGVATLRHYDFQGLRYSPSELQRQFKKSAWQRVIGYMTREPLHQKEVFEATQAAHQMDAQLLLSLAVGAIQTADPAHYARVHALEAVLAKFPPHSAVLALLPLAQQADRDGILLHAMTLRNYGCTHYMLDERSIHLADKQLADKHGDYQKLQEEISQYEQLLGIALVPKPHAAQGGPSSVKALSPEDFKTRLEQGGIPEGFSWPEVLVQMRKIIKPRTEQGCTIFFTGLSGSGKSTIANALLATLMETGSRPITLLDGDIVRKNLSSELGFSKAHRDLNIRRIGYVASEITRHGGIAICAPIAPYAMTRDAVRSMIEPLGGFLEVHLSTSLEVCEQRDRKGLYAKARAGIIKSFTGISDPYEIPENPELRIDTENLLPGKAVKEVLRKLQELGYLAG